MEALAKKRCSFARLLFFLSTPSAPGSAATTKGDTPVDEEHGCLLSLARRAEERERTRNKLSEVSVFFWGGGLPLSFALSFASRNGRRRMQRVFFFSFLSLSRKHDLQKKATPPPQLSFYKALSANAEKSEKDTRNTDRRKRESEKRESSGRRSA